MASPALQRAAALACGVNVLLLAALQFATGRHPPLFLFVLFSGVWVFGALALMRWPTFGAVGTALYGVILGVQVLVMHGANAFTALVSLGAFCATAFAVVFLLERRRERG